MSGKEKLGGTPLFCHRHCRYLRTHLYLASPEAFIALEFRSSNGSSITPARCLFALSPPSWFGDDVASRNILFVAGSSVFLCCNVVFKILSLQEPTTKCV